MTYYLSGPMSGYPDLNVPAFEATAAWLRRYGLEVVSPHEIAATPRAGDSEWVAAMRADIRALTECDGLIAMQGWSRSKGATTEVLLARSLGLTVLFVQSGQELATVPCQEDR